jgi:hypothetical protein
MKRDCPMKMRLSMFSVIGVTAVLGTIWFAAAQTTKNTASANVRQRTTWERVDDAARNLNGADQTRIRGLVNEVFADNGIDERIVATAGSVPDRLVAAEASFQSGKTAGISEDKVVATVNLLARHFNAPQYAYTNTKEFRRLRLKMVSTYPNLIGRGSAATRDDSKHHFDRTMSPVEAFHITSTLIFQKVFNPEFQFTQQEIDKATQQVNAADTATLTDRVGKGERTREMVDVIRKGASTMSLRDMLSQSEQALDELGIPR